MSVRTAHAPREELGPLKKPDHHAEIGTESPSCIPNEVPAHSAEGPSQRPWHLEFAEIVAPLLDQLHRLARRILRSDDMAEDAVQEALTSLWRAGRLPPNPTGWLSRAVVHRSLHLNRCRKRRRCHEERACSHRSENQKEGEASRTLEARELGVRIDAAIAQLPERFREVFLLREVEQMDYGAIADLLRVPVGTVRSRLFRSREALQKALSEGGWPENEATEPPTKTASTLDSPS
ncbi:RNA polymerase sigma-70 factor, ECF subfamily [Singulisphaera sp. GP187]|uniref:RNA polymerase sigma factor n=1 Tax=Singulisphaera sp. GP187 TaxID=1882752 RepID=UPI00092B767B|nr:RNA polymerase sigma factor [Singulisphaera sp. GP187]SIO62439.1 RNA polymerase sigma-70 factor, ECF subfamily [Singulisphaera sp. GP187]